jgi:hypothetical protein
LATAEEIPFLGTIPIDPKLTSYLSDSKDFFEAHSTPSPSLISLQKFVASLREPAGVKPEQMKQEANTQ